MSTRDDATLNARERAALANLEAAAAADDPKLAARLRGSRRLHLLVHLPRPPRWMRNSWLGGPVALVGLVLLVLGVSVGSIVGLAGAVLTTAGLLVLAGAVRRRWMRRPRPERAV